MSAFFPYQSHSISLASKRGPSVHTREYSDEFIDSKKKHSAVESAINALQVHGLNKCRDHGIDGFKRYVAIAVIARNIQKIGALILNQERERENHKKAA